MATMLNMPSDAIGDGHRIVDLFVHLTRDEMITKLCQHNTYTDKVDLAYYGKYHAAAGADDSIRDDLEVIRQEALGNMGVDNASRVQAVAMLSPRAHYEARPIHDPYSIT